MRAKSFLYVCAGIFLLALSYHFGASSAGAQVPGNPVVTAFPGAGAAGNFAIVTAGGDIYAGNELAGMRFLTNVFSGATPTTQQSWGQVKARYR